MTITLDRLAATDQTMYTCVICGETMTGDPCVIYARISADQAGDEHGVKNQTNACHAYAHKHAMVPVRLYIDNDISALTGKHRPDYAAMMRAAAAGEFTRLVTYQTSRIWRNRKERADGIEVFMNARVAILAAKGPSLDLSTAYGRAMAGLLGEFDTLESEVKRERQQLASRGAAERGERRKGGARQFGWTPDKTAHLPEEADAIRTACRWLLGGGSQVTLARVVDSWTEKAHAHVPGYRPPNAPFGPLVKRPWTFSAIKGILLHPANAGLSAYHGEILAKGKWEAIVTEETQKAVRAKLDNGPRATPDGRQRRAGRTLMGSLGLCSCGATVNGARDSKGNPIYRCSAVVNGDAAPDVRHVKRSADPVNAYVTAMVLARVSAADAADLLPTTASTDIDALTEERKAINRNLAEMAADRAAGLLTRDEQLAGSARGKKRLAEIAVAIETGTREDVLAPLIAAEDAAEEWETYDLATKRAIIDALMTVTLKSPGQGQRNLTFDPKTIQICWKRGS